MDKLKDLLYTAQMPLLSLFNKDVLNAIRHAGKHQNLVTITYKDSKGEVSTRKCEPYEFKDGGVYMYDVNKQSIRLFKADRIMHAKVERETFIPRWPIKLS